MFFFPRLPRVSASTDSHCSNGLSIMISRTPVPKSFDNNAKSYRFIKFPRPALFYLFKKRVLSSGFSNYSESI